MKAVVMAGGEGSRLRPLTSRRPKPLVPVVGRPCMEHVLRLLRRHGITEVVVTLQYLGAEIRNYFGDGQELGMEIEYAVEDRPLGTAGSVRNAAHLLQDTFLVISGDALTDIDLTSAIGLHRDRGARATIVLARVPTPLEYGVVVTDADGRIRRFLEKPSWGEVFSDQVNTGIYVIEREVLDAVAADVSVDWSQDVFPAMLEHGDPLYGMVGDGYWCDIGNVASYLQANWDALEGRVMCELDGTRRADGVWIATGAELDPAAQVIGPAFVGRDAMVRGNAFLNGPVVVDRHAVVDAGAKVSSSVLWPQAYVGERARLRQAVVCSGATLKPLVLLEEGAVIGDGCVIGSGAVIAPNVRIWPHKDIEPGATVRDSVIWAGTWRSSLFTSYGITGLNNVELTPEWCARLGAAWAASHPKGSELAICRDRRPSSRMIKRAMTAGMLSAGARVLDLSELPLPVTSHLARESAVAGAVHVLASPLDARSADIRIFDERGIPIDRRAERRLENIFFREDFRRVVPDEIEPIAYADWALDAYAVQVLAGIDIEGVRAARPKVLVDYDFSSASLVLPRLLRAVDAEVIPLHAGFDEGPRTAREPIQFREQLAQSALITRTVEAAVGVVVDAAAQRLQLIDDRGDPLDSDEALAVMTWLALSTSPGGTVVVPASAPGSIGTIATRLGGRAVVTKVDPPSVLRAAVRTDAVLGGDDNGGYVWTRHLAAFDAMFTVLELIALLARTRRTLSSIRDELPRGAHLRHDEFCPWEAKGRVMRRLLDQHRDERVDLTDGLKLPTDGGWVLVLPDPDRPEYHIIASMNDLAAAEAVIGAFAAEVRTAIDAAEGPLTS
ncbi:MAG TPA: sugar phosphate nucleotidyltransferase [Verrucomicrobiae bacterium]|nr:sugar phosphate nucleotidyltransferase [Verrucomicrobiae bacterium]